MCTGGWLYKAPVRTRNPGPGVGRTALHRPGLIAGDGGYQASEPASQATRKNVS
jgi:hypothetical protein